MMLRGPKITGSKVLIRILELAVLSAWIRGEVLALGFKGLGFRVNGLRFRDSG